MMKKITAVFAAAVIICLSCVSVFAAGLNASEQSVLANMNTPANMNGNSVYVPASYLNQAESYFNTIDMTSEQAGEINGYINSGRSFLEGTGKSSMKELTPEQVKTIMSYANSAAAVLNLNAAGDESGSKIMNSDGEVVIDDSGNVIKATGGADYSLTVALCSVFAVMLAGCTAFTLARKKSLQYEDVR